MTIQLKKKKIDKKRKKEKKTVNVSGSFIAAKQIWAEDNAIINASPWGIFGTYFRLIKYTY